MTAPAVRGWCPGALRPMESGDGLIVRLKLTCGIVPLDLATRIADWARDFGNGEIDLTARANLQIRGVASATLPGLQDAIAEAGLLDANPDGEAIRNVAAGPLAGLDPDALLDIRPTVAALEARLANDERLYRLPAKFCFAVDDGGRFGLGDVRADVRFGAVAGSAFAIRLDGAPDVTLGPCRLNEVAEVAADLAGVFLAQQNDARRMRDLVARVGAAAIAKEAGLASNASSSPASPQRGDVGSLRDPGDGATSAAGGLRPDVIMPLPGAACRSLSAGARSFYAGLMGGGVAVGVGFPFGRISAGNLRRLAEQAAQSGATELRLSPWRAILVPCPSQEDATHLAEALPQDAFILDPADPRRRVAACVGAPACPRATTDTRADAGRLASLIAENQFLHLSGCAKGCAHPRPAPVTLVGNDGRYDLICEGAPSDPPLRRGLTLDEAASYLREMAAMQTRDRAS